MANYPSPCDNCPQNDHCKRYEKCQPWLARYRYRQKQINAFAKRVLSKQKNQSPCLTCTKVKDHKKCANLHCKEWREWFLSRWDKINGYSEKHLPDHKERMMKGIQYEYED